jgi:uncharacterized protein involved in exopolysaccharide biosynthesis
MEFDSKEKTWADYVALLRRRWRATLCVFAFVALGAVFVAYSLPAVYESSATILIEQQGIPTDFVETTVNAYAEQLLQTIYQRVASATKVAEMIRALDLYPDDRDVLPEEELLSRFRDNTRMSPKNVETIHSRTGRSAIITFGFEIAFQDSDPVKARDVAEQLSNLFVSYNAELRAETAARTTAFLDTEAVGLETQLAEVAERIARFKEIHANNLPADQDVNLRTWERLREELTSVEGSLRETRELKSILESELIDIPRYRPVLDESGEPILGGTDQLAAAQQELIRLRGRYSENHPSIINLRREIAALSASPVNRSGTLEQLRTQLLDRRRELSGAREVYSDSHPNVVALEQAVQSLEQQLYELESELEISGDVAVPPNNPVYVQTVTRIDAAAEELADLSRRRGELLTRIEDLDQRRLTAPQVEREFSALTQEQDVLLTQYRGLRNLEGEAALGEALETGQSGERLTIVEAARVPASPVSPNRISITFLGFVLAIAAALGAASIMDAMDTKVRGRSDLQQLLGAPPIGIIPYTESASDSAKRVTINVTMSAVLIGALILTLARVLV